MTDRFSSKSKTLHVSYRELHSLMKAAFLNAGLSSEAAEHSADSLAEAEASGKTGHGLIRTEYVYREALRKKPAEVKSTAEGPCFLAVDGGKHMGYHPGIIGIERGTTVARTSGSCITGIRNIGHSGMLAFFARRIAAEGFWGIVMSHCTPLMAPYGGGRRVFGTNPIALGVPRMKEHPLIIDLSFAATTFGAVSLARQEGKSIEEGTAIDSSGRTTTDPRAVMEGGSLLPAAGHKGSAIAFIIQLICGPLIGAAPIPETASNYGLVFFIIRSDLFHSNEETEQGVEELIAAVEGCPPIEGTERVILPGERSIRWLEHSLKHGIDVDRGLWEKAERLAKAGDE
jgi:ureidoglycolate dehydrogenase (NAD+)